MSMVLAAVAKGLREFMYRGLTAQGAVTLLRPRGASTVTYQSQSSLGERSRPQEVPQEFLCRLNKINDESIKSLKHS